MILSRLHLQALAVLAVSVLGVALYLNSSAHELHDPDHALQQLDAFYLDQQAPLPELLGLPTDGPVLLVICTDCVAPDVPTRVVLTGDVEVARAYGLQTSDGRIGPGYAVIDADGDVRYRTFDPDPASHTAELRVLLRAAE